MKVHLRMLGCRLNQSEIDTMARQLEQQGHTIVATPEEADEVIVNTCAVTNEATKSSRKLIRELHRANQNAAINVTGCYAQISPNDIAVLDGVQRVVDNVEKETLVSQITGQPLAPFDIEPHEREQRPGTANRTRAFVKVQDGCDNACTFCITTVARGAGRSRAVAEIVQEVGHLYALGYLEVVLTGVHLGSYGHDWGQYDGLTQLVRRILAETAIPRLRLSSLEPWDLSPDFFDLWADARLQPHLHLPLQSGCDATLRRMRRNTSQAEFRALVQAARVAIPNLNITSDVIVGFPGETHEEWAISKAFIEAMDFGGLHIFRYSVRPGTPAARMKGHVNNTTKKARSNSLHAHAQAQTARFAQRYVGHTLPVLWESVTGSSEVGFVNVGYTNNYIRVQCTHPRVLSNHITPATLNQVTDDTVQASAIIS